MSQFLPPPPFSSSINWISIPMSQFQASSARPWKEGLWKGRQGCGDGRATAELVVCVMVDEKLRQVMGAATAKPGSHIKASIRLGWRRALCRWKTVRPPSLSICVAGKWRHTASTSCYRCHTSADGEGVHHGTNRWQPWSC